MRGSIDIKKAAFLVIFALAWLSIVAAILLNGWSRTWTALHIPSMSPVFADMRTVQGAVLSEMAGLNPQGNNPGDPWGRTLDYPMLWLSIAKLFQLDQETNFLIFVGAYVLAYIVCCFLLLRMAPSLYLLLAAFSWTSLLAVERGNNDLLAFALLFAAVTFSQKYLRAFLILLMTALKVYPVLLLVSLAKKPKILIPLVLITAGYFLFHLSELKIIQAGNTALSDPVGMFASYGFDTTMRNIQVIFGGLPPAAYAVIKFAFLLVSLGLIFLLSWTKYLDLESSSTYKNDLFISGAAIFSGTYLITSNWDYRLIFLLFCIPYLLTIQNKFVKHSMLSGILLSMYFGFLWANPPSLGSLLCALIKHYVFIMVSACLFKEMIQTLPVAVRERLKQLNIPVISLERLKPVFPTSLGRTISEVRTFSRKPGMWLRIVVIVAVLVYFNRTAQKYFLPRIMPRYGTLNLHISGLRPPGHIIIQLKRDLSQNITRGISMSFNSTEMIYAVEALYYGDYFIQVIHDENNNQAADPDSATGLFSEGFGMANLDRLDLSSADAVKAGSASGRLKYDFNRKDETVEIQMYYPPFPWNHP